MRRLIPFDFGDLGAAEWMFLLLALGGLSLFAPGARQGPAAVVAGLLVALLAVLRLATATGAPWDRFGPILVAPPFAAAVVLAPRLRPALERLLGPRGLVAAWVSALAVLAAFGPFDLYPVRDAPEWTFLVLLGLGVASLCAPARLGRPLVGPLRAWHALALAWLALCGATAPFGVGWPGALVLLGAFATAHAVVAQGPQMRRYVRRRLIGAPIVLVLLLMASFVIMKAAPGSPFDKEKRVAPEIRELLEAEYGFDDPLPVQFGRYMANLLWEGDLGLSMKQKGRTVNEIIARHAAPSLRLGLAATALALVIGLTSGLVAGLRRNSVFDYASMTGAMIGLALPTFVVGPLLVLVFAMKLRWFHVAGWDDFPRDLVLPAIALSLPFAARVARLTRAGMLEVVHQDYVRTARAKGLSEPVIVVRHTLKGALLPVVTFLGPAIAQLLTGSLVVETIFGVPGLGVEFVQSALNRDYSLAMGLVVFFGALLIAFNLVVDVAYGFLDPRIRHA